MYQLIWKSFTQEESFSFILKTFSKCNQSHSIWITNIISHSWLFLLISRSRVPRYPKEPVSLFSSIFSLCFSVSSHPYSSIRSHSGWQMGRTAHRDAPRGSIPTFQPLYLPSLLSTRTMSCSPSLALGSGLLGGVANSSFDLSSSNFVNVTITLIVGTTGMAT